MRHRGIWLAGLAAAVTWLCVAPARAEDEAPSDPTRGHWDTFLDPVRDGEDKITDAQKSFEDRTKIHVGAGIAYQWWHNFDLPPTKLNTLHSLDPYHDTASFNLGQLSVSRPSQGWFIPGFGLKLDAGKVAERIKPDYNGNGVVAPGDPFENNSFDVQELYGTWAVPEDSPALKGLSVKGGKFVTLLGAEVIEPWANFNVSRSFLFGYAIPFTHTGGLVSYPFTDKLAMTIGPVVGWDTVKESNNRPTGLGNLTYLATDELTLSANGTYGPEQAHNDHAKRGIIDLVATVKPAALPDLTLLLNYDWGHEDDVVDGTRPGIWQGFAAVANYNFTPRCSGAFRGEWFADTDGVRTGTPQTLWELTFTTRYLITQHAILRFEYRHDGSTERVFPANETGAWSGQDIAGFEFTYLFS